MSNNKGLLDLEINNKDNINNSKNSIRDSIYGKIDVSVKTMDNVITVLLILLFLSVFLGIIL